VGGETLFTAALNEFSQLGGPGVSFAGRVIMNKTINPRGCHDEENFLL